MATTAPHATPATPRSPWWPQALSWGGLIGLWAVLGATTWATWPDLDVDCGRDAYIAARLAGQLPGGAVMLYRDVQYQFGPLAPYWNSFLLRIFGLHLDVFYISGLLAALGIVLASYGIARKLLTPWNAWLASAAVLVVFAFRVSLFNYVYPYTFAANYGLLWLALALWIGIERQHPGPKAEWQLWGLGTLTGFCLLTKQEFGIAAIVVALITLAAPGFDQRGIARTRAWLVVAAPAALLSFGVYGYFLLRLGWRQLAGENLLPLYLLHNQRIFYRRLSAAHPHRDWFIFWWRQRQWWAPSLAWIVGIHWLLRGLERLARRPLSRIATLPCLLLFPLWLWQKQWGRELSWKVFDFYFWPLYLLFLLGILAVRLRRQWTEKERMLILPLAAGGVLLTRTLGNPNLTGYANLLCWPFIPVWIYFVWEALPLVLTGSFKPTNKPTLQTTRPDTAPSEIPDNDLHTRKRPQANRTVATAGVAVSALLALTLAGYAWQDLQAARNRNFPVQSPAGEIRAGAARGQVWRQTLKALQRHPGRRLLSIPESAFLYVMTNRVSPLPYDHLIPGYISGPRHEHQALAMLRRSRPQTIVIFKRTFPEYFPAGQKDTRFGHAFDRRVLAWIEQHYRQTHYYGNAVYGARIYRIQPSYAIKTHWHKLRLPWE